MLSLGQHFFAALARPCIQVWPKRIKPSRLPTLVHVAVKQSIVCSHEILLCDAFEFPGEKHYVPWTTSWRLPGHELPMTTSSQQKNPAAVLYFTHLLHLFR